MMTTKFERSSRSHSPLSDRNQTDSKIPDADTTHSQPSPQAVGRSTDGVYLSESRSDTGEVETVTLGDIRLELLGDLRRVITRHRDRRWQQFFDYWLQLAETRGALPSRQAIDPLQMPRRLMPNLFMTEVVYEAGNRPRFRFRLLGQEITEQEHTKPGQYVHELGGSQGTAPLETQYLDCLEHRLWLRHTNLSWADRQKSFIRYEVLLLPLARDGREIDAMIGLAIYQN